jgi:hypothetical protein
LKDIWVVSSFDGYTQPLQVQDLEECAFPSFESILRSHTAGSNGKCVFDFKGNGQRFQQDVSTGFMQVLLSLQPGQNTTRQFFGCFSFPVPILLVMCGLFV